jgi:dTDP-4-dehydrorhamnose reductase
MRILITGGRGMLGRTLLHRLAHHQCLGTDIDDCDIAIASQVETLVSDFQPNVIIHCAAMTAVDACESRWDDAMRINAIGSANVAAACHRHRAKMIAISTDYVFSGSLERPYHEWDEPGPVSVYGQSKLAGENFVRQLCPEHLIARIAWLYGPGGPSFLHTIVRLSQTQNQLKVVDDQHGNPTSTFAVAEQLAQLIELPLAGTVHLTCEGETTWFGFAQELLRLLGRDISLQPCTTAEFPRPAPRPANSRLDNAFLRLQGLSPMPHWRAALAEFVRFEFPMTNDQ